jgi:Cysteine-rich secretory protein family
MIGHGQALNSKGGSGKTVMISTSFLMGILFAASIPVQATPHAPVAATPSEKPSTEVRLLAAHNSERVRLGLKPLKWSPVLAENARKWANHLANTGTFEHAVPAKGEADQGENLWMGTRASYDPEEMVQAWIDERTLYKSGKFPAVSTTGDWRDVGHYTQLIWHSTSQIGCAISANQSDEILVCRYDPPGNWEGQHPFGR